MVKINPSIEAKCNECPTFKPKMDVQRTYADDICHLTSINISCENKRQCDSLEEYLRKTI